MSFQNVFSKHFLIDLFKSFSKHTLQHLFKTSTKHLYILNCIYRAFGLVVLKTSFSKGSIIMRTMRIQMSFTMNPRLTRDKRRPLPLLPSSQSKLSTSPPISAPTGRTSMWRSSWSLALSSTFSISSLANLKIKRLPINCLQPTGNQPIRRQTVFRSHDIIWTNDRPSLESQFSLVGDDGTKNIEEIQEPLIKESENIFRYT